MLFSSRPVNTRDNFQLVDYAFISWRLISLPFPCYGNHSSKRINRFNPNFCFFSSKTDFRLLPSRPPGRIRVTAGSRPVVAGRLSLREVRYQLAMLRRKRNRHSSPSVRPTTLAPPVHHLALRFLKMPYISSDRGPIIVFSHWMTLFCCLFKLEWFDLADDHTIVTLALHTFSISVEENLRARASINPLTLPPGVWPQLVPQGAIQLCLVTLCHYTQAGKSINNHL